MAGFIRICRRSFGLVVVAVTLPLTAGAEAYPPVGELPVQAELPDPFARLDGTRVRSVKDWPAQRSYLKSMLEHYFYGSRPPRPDASEVKLEQVAEKDVFAGKAREEHYQLTISRNGRQATCRFWLVRPKRPGPYPAIVKNCRASFHKEEGQNKDLALVAERDWAAAQEAVRRGYLLCKFLRTDLAEDTPDPTARRRGVYPLYPEHDWGAVGVWCWGQSVVVDALARLGYADLDKLVATGHSRGGQTAMAAGIFDERFDVVVACTGGFGSCGTLRVRDPKGVRGEIDYIGEILGRHHPHWFCKRYLEFAGRQNRIPFDGHTLVALIAPRSVLNTNGLEDQVNNPLSMEVGLRVGEKVHRWLGKKEAVRLHWRPGKHGQRAEDWQALLDFADEVFFGKPGKSRYNRWRYPDRNLPKLSWEVP